MHPFLAVPSQSEVATKWRHRNRHRGRRDTFACPLAQVIVSSSTVSCSAEGLLFGVIINLWNSGLHEHVPKDLLSPPHRHTAHTTRTVEVKT